MRSISRVAGVSINTVTKLLVNVGKACERFHDEKVRGLKTKQVQADEIWSFVGYKQKNVKEYDVSGTGDCWVFTGMDAQSKLMISWYVGDRTSDSAEQFLYDLKSRVTNRIQLSTDSFSAYKKSVEKVFGNKKIAYAQVHKIYLSMQVNTRYSPAQCVGMEIRPMSGDPNPIYISTSYVERQNLSMRMGMRRFTRLTNAFSKKIENHCCAIALHYAYYNFVRIHGTLGETPAMKAGLMTKPMELWEIAKLTEIYNTNV